MAPGFQNLWKNSRRLSRRRPFPVSIRRASAGLPGAALSRVTCLRRNSVESLGHLVTPVSAGLAVVLVGSSAFRASVTASVCPTPYSKGFRGAPLRSVGRTDQPPPSQMPVAAAACHSATGVFPGRFRRHQGSLETLQATFLPENSEK
ncbi:uncharacterized protein LOC144233973 [Crocuta crocuta]